jgi:hypothetical protein
VVTNIARPPPAVQVLHANAFGAARGIAVDPDRVLPLLRRRRKIEPSGPGRTLPGCAV